VRCCSLWCGTDANCTATTADSMRKRTEPMMSAARELRHGPRKCWSRPLCKATPKHTRRNRIPTCLLATYKLLAQLPQPARCRLVEIHQVRHRLDGAVR